MPVKRFVRVVDEAEAALPPLLRRCHENEREINDWGKRLQLAREEAQRYACANDGMTAGHAQAEARLRSLYGRVTTAHDSWLVNYLYERGHELK